MKKFLIMLSVFAFFFIGSQTAKSMCIYNYTNAVINVYFWCGLFCTREIHLQVCPGPTNGAEATTGCYHCILGNPQDSMATIDNFESLCGESLEHPIPGELCDFDILAPRPFADRGLTNVSGYAYTCQNVATHEGLSIIGTVGTAGEIGSAELRCLDQGMEDSEAPIIEPAWCTPGLTPCTVF